MLTRNHAMNLNGNSNENPEGDPKRDSQKWMRSLGLFSVILGELLGFTGIGVGLGYYLWTRGKAPWWIVLGLGISGLVLAFWRMFVISKKEWD